MIEPDPSAKWRHRELLAQRFGSLWKVPRYRLDPENPKQAGHATIAELHPIPRAPKPTPPIVPAAPVQAVGQNQSSKPKFAKKTMIKGAPPEFEITRDENAVESGMPAAYTRPNADEPTGLVTIYGEHPGLRTRWPTCPQSRRKCLRPRRRCQGRAFRRNARPRRQGRSSTSRCVRQRGADRWRII
jgi:hypothetical protein